MQYRGLTLDPFQAEAIEALSAGRSVLVCAPTGTGKTIIADHAVEATLAAGKKIVYTAPIKALSNQKFRDYCRLFGEEKVGLVTGDLVIRPDAPCRVMTTEILRNMLLVGQQLHELGLVVFDEIHFLDDRERGTVWEETLIYLPSEVQILGLSATLRNVRAFAAWLGAVRGSPVSVVEHHQRSVPLHFLVAHHEEGLLQPREFERRFRKKGGGREDSGDRRGGRRSRASREDFTSHVDIFHMLADDDLLPCLYFAFSRKITEQHARGLGMKVHHSLLTRDEGRRADALLDAFAQTDSGSALDEELHSLYRKGIAFHHAGLHVQLKALVEDLYEQKLIKVLYCTSTFALGINMPARTVVFDGLRKFDGTTTRPLTTREFMQKAGRAGRRGLDTEGHVVLRVDTGDWPVDRQLLDTYLEGRSEPVRSSFSLSFHSIVNLLQNHDRAHIRQMVEKSFLSWHRQQEAGRLREQAEAMVESASHKAHKEAHKLQRRADHIENQTWEEFERKIDFLQRNRYIDADGTFNAGGRILQSIQMEEIFVTELILAGVFEGLDPASTFGLLCAVNKEFPRDVKLYRKLHGDDRALAQAAEKVRHTPTVTEAEYISGQSVTWCPDMIPFGRMWAEGRSLQELGQLVVASTDITGDLVGAFRRAKDLLGQLRDVFRDDKARANALMDMVRAVSRDEVMVVD